MDFNVYVGKKCFIKTNEGLVYNADVISVDYLGKDTNDADIFLINFTDRFKRHLSLSNKEIAVMREEQMR